MSESNATNEQKEAEEATEANNSPYILEESDKHDELSLEDEHDKPINSYASMIYFKDKSYIKEEPLSPGGVDCWKSEDRQTASPGVEESQQSSNGMKMHEELTQRTAKVVPINCSSSISPYTNKSCSSPTISSSNEYVLNSSGGLKEKDSRGIPRKPLTPYMSYRNMIFEEIKHKYPGCSPYDLACLISSKWSMLTDSERKVWEDQYEDDMKKYKESLRKIASNPSKREWTQQKKADLQPTPVHVLKGGSSSRTEEVKLPQLGMCKWCRQFTSLQDFTSVLDGREIYCTGLCSEKCFVEAAKQINSIEGGSSKPRYIKYSSQSKTSQSDDFATYSSSGSRYSSSSSHSPLVNELLRSNKSSSLFDWDSYLSLDTQSTAAHWMYFKQARYPPPNNFVVGMKLEACSYNASNMSPTFSLATVVATSGARILLHFDGADSKSDIWRLPDSGDIHPVGWTEGSLLKAPLGYKYDPAKYSKYFASNLQSAEIAPARLFKKEPQKPMENYFAVGMKLEAVNKQSPSVIGVASIVDVEGEQVKIEFDGYKGIGYWCHYYDRDLFAAGWCARTGHPLQPPGSKVSQILQRQSQSSSSPPPSMVATEPRSPLLSASTYQRESVSSSWKEKSGSPNSVEVFLSMDCYCGPYIEAPKLKKLSRVYKGNMVTVLKNVLEEVIKCAIDPKTVFGFLKPGRGNCVIKAICDGVAFQCCLNSIDRVSTFWRVLEQFSDNLRCCPNMFSSTELRVACTRCNNNRTRAVSTLHEYHRVTTHHSNKRHHQHHSSSFLPSSSSSRNEIPSRSEQARHVTSRHDRLSHTHSYSMSSYDLGRRESEPDSPIVISTSSRKDSVFEPALRSVSNMETIVQPDESKTAALDTSYDSEKEDVTVDDFDEPVLKKKKVSKKKVDGIDISTAPKSWSIDDVISFIQQSDLKDYVEHFRENEIDGKALLLLQRDLVLSHMGFKLGPAVKLLDMIEELKTVQENFS